ncbi:MAG: GNAT family N-acetyltransferase [Chloroherpetonaceae bacterium]|nr:GNAT family N-acetyltransferase [Chloroherpetonaceae bacterium]MDW8436550.1 GNAT family N-acetyltransferase [Chloroherpetonaceae bacterium]
MSERESSFIVRKIKPEDNPAIANVIRAVMPEFGADGDGFAIKDAEVDAMFEAYSQPRCAYFVVEMNGNVIGGGGIAPLQGGDDHVCELKKMYFLPEGRGKGIGQEVLNRCLEAARAFGYKTCYLETLEQMGAARKLYEKNGFVRLTKRMGNTGHFGCDRFYAKPL